MRKYAHIVLPPGFAWIRSSIRLGIAGALWLAGFTHVALIVAVLAVISLIATVETQIARAIATSLSQKKIDPDNAAPQLRG